MKYLTLKVVTVPGISEEALARDPKADQFSYRDQIMTILSINGRDEGGMDLAEMKRRLRILDVVEEAKDGDQIQLEDADHEKLKALLNRPIWTFMSRHLIRFIDDVSKAESLPRVQDLPVEEAELDAEHHENGRVAELVG